MVNCVIALLAPRWMRACTRRLRCCRMRQTQRRTAQYWSCHSAHLIMETNSRRTKRMLSGACNRSSFVRVHSFASMVGLDANVGFLLYIVNKRREERKRQSREPSERRLQLRAACRERWQDDPPLTLERVQTLVPSLFRHVRFVLAICGSLLLTALPFY